MMGKKFYIQSQGGNNEQVLDHIAVLYLIICFLSESDQNMDTEVQE